MKTEYDHELLVFLDQDIASERVKILEETRGVIDEIERKFVMGATGIAWEKNELIFFNHFDQLGDHDYLNEAGSFLNKIAGAHPYLSDDRIIVIGDSLTNLSYEMSFKNFLDVYGKFLSIPQHTYI